MIIFFTIFTFFFAVSIGIGYWISAPKYTGPVSEHFDGHRFINPDHIQAKGFADVFKWMLFRKRGQWNEQTEPAFGEKPASRVDNGIRITFVNHSTFLIQVDGLNILTDPVWSKRTSPFQWAGPKRMRPPGIRLEDLPEIDIILLSHNHWDHLDIVTVKEIFTAHHPKIITPLGVKSFLGKKGVQGLGDLDWWQETVINERLTVQAVPAQHFSGRGMFDRDATLWCGYLLKRSGGNVYFVGDTGYNANTFTEIGKRSAPIAVALVPIGAFKPEWFMSPIHCSPEDAVKIHQETGTKVSIATHFGTFPLADDGQYEPVEMLKKALEKSGVDQNSFLVLKEGTACNV
jgi:L-ascorbate metabolism protein UlaG (beta-lactamase superfamily)